MDKLDPNRLSLLSNLAPSLFSIIKLWNYMQIRSILIIALEAIWVMSVQNIHEGVKKYIFIELRYFSEADCRVRPSSIKFVVIELLNLFWGNSKPSMKRSGNALSKQLILITSHSLLYEYSLRSWHRNNNMYPLVGHTRFDTAIQPAISCMSYFDFHDKRRR